ncbi:phosphotransferase [Streptomyces sp. ISL-98]|uniref:phosphotransferase n=1 Tax=Streptomyces sp. ISL-98 TaxID=2819192 RepID=UPI001BE677E9|nr:phosphotransferase [Streptomyces sp. ISL-98]MBT2506999.1 phosphotransferase [Streptomyces sp. ISL-98]
MTTALPGTAPDLADLLGPYLDDVLAACRQHVGPVTRIERATGGNVSHVFRVHGERGRAVLKIRSTCFSNIPEIATNPELIADEHRALGLYCQALPDLFPKVLAFLPHAHALLMTDVFPDGLTWRQHLDQRPATPAEADRLGRALARVHHATASVRTPIRPQGGDDRFREHTFDFCLRPTGHPALLAACTALAALPDQQLVLGDVAPKNISLAHGGVAFVDLDNVHYNAPLYDVAYLLAHVLLHHLRWPAELPAITAALLDAYTGSAPAGHWQQDPLLATVTAGVLLYRLATHVVPYPPTAPPAVGERYRIQVVRLLDTGPFTVLDLLRAAGMDPE